MNNIFWNGLHLIGLCTVAFLFLIALGAYIIERIKKHKK